MHNWNGGTLRSEGGRAEHGEKRKNSIIGNKKAMGAWRGV